MLVSASGAQCCGCVYLKSTIHGIPAQVQHPVQIPEACSTDPRFDIRGLSGPFGQVFPTELPYSYTMEAEAHKM